MPPSADASQASALAAQLARKTREVEIIQFIAAQIISTLDLGQILTNVLVSMEEMLGFAHSMILLLDEEGTGLQVVASRGYPDSGIDAQVPLGQGVIGVAARRQKVLRMNNIGMQRRYVNAVRANTRVHGQAAQLPGLENVQSQIAIPLLVNDRLTGVLAVESPQLNAFDELDETLLMILGNQTASAIENARLYGVAEERLAELDRLNESLEERVRQRTAELTETRDRLAMQEKMASLGHLVSGLAHEINNPIGAVNSSADVARRCAERIRDQPSQLERPLALLLANLATVETASQRIVDLVDSLKNFAHLDEAEYQLADLHAGLDNTLTLLQPELRDRVEVVRQFGELPRLYCNPGQINQVFMGLLLNAAQAMAGAGTIRISTWAAAGILYMRVEDSGRGIEPQGLERLFDFGFGVDKARVKMGAGLPTAYRIAQEHGGRIEVESQVGVGSAFTVVLPHRQGPEDG